MKHPYFKSFGPGIRQLKDGMSTHIFQVPNYLKNTIIFSFLPALILDQSIFMLDGIKLAKDPGNASMRRSAMGKKIRSWFGSKSPLLSQFVQSCCLVSVIRTVELLVKLNESFSQVNDGRACCSKMLVIL